MLYVRYPANAPGGVPVYANFAAFPASGANGALAIDGSTHILYEYNTSTVAWEPIASYTAYLAALASAGAPTTVGTIDSEVTPSANGATIFGGQLIMQSASATAPGLVNNTTQSFSGVKTFTGNVGMGVPPGASALRVKNTTGSDNTGLVLVSDTNVAWNIAAATNYLAIEDAGGNPYIFLRSGLTGFGMGNPLFEWDFNSTDPSTVIIPTPAAHNTIAVIRNGSAAPGTFAGLGFTGSSHNLLGGIFSIQDTATSGSEVSHLEFYTQNAGVFTKGMSLSAAGNLTVTGYVAGDNVVTSVLQYGATGNGTTDDTAALQAAINSGLPLFFPRGVYRITDSLTVTNSSSLNWSGLLTESIIMNEASANKPSIVFTDCQHFLIDGLTIAGKAAFPNHALRFCSAGGQTCGFGTVTNVLLQPNGNGILLEKLNTINFSNIWYWPSGSTGSGATSSAGQRQHAVFVDSTVSGNYCNEVVFRDSTLNGVQSGYAMVDMQALALGDLSNIQFINCELEAPGSGVSAVFSHATNLAIRDCFLENGTVTLTDCRYSVIDTAYNPFTVTLAGSCYQVVLKNMIVGNLGSSFVIGASCDQCGATDSSFQTVTDSGTNSYFINCLRNSTDTTDVLNDLKADYFGSKTASSATAGVVRLANTNAVNWRNAANSTNLGLTLDASDIFQLGSSLAIAGNLGIGAASSGLAQVQVTSPTTLTGTVSNSAAGTVVTGSGTRFLTELRVGNSVTIGAQTVVVATITSDTAMTTAAITNANSGATATRNALADVFVYPNGNVQIGGSSLSVPLGSVAAQLHVVSTAESTGTSTAAIPGIYATSYTGAGSTTTGVPSLNLARSRGTEASPSAVTSGDLLGNLLFRGYDAATLGLGARAQVFTTENWSSTAHGSKWVFSIIPNTTTTTTTALTIDQDKSATFTGLVVPSTGVKGVSTTTDATAGNVGEYVESLVTTPTNIPGATTAWGDLTSISLGAGDWDVTGLASFNANGALLTSGQIGISTTSGNSATGLTNGVNVGWVTLTNSTTINRDGLVPSYRMSLSGTTTVYLKANFAYTVATPQYTCRLSARRVQPGT